MGATRPTVIVIIPRLLVSTALLPLLLVSGLLTFPTACHCGADLPHQHALYDLADHSHAPGDHHDHDGADAKHPPAVIEADQDEPALKLPTVNLLGQGQAAMIGQAASSLMEHGLNAFPEAYLPLSGRSATPDPPPPRS